MLPSLSVAASVLPSYSRRGEYVLSLEATNYRSNGDELSDTKNLRIHKVSSSRVHELWPRRQQGHKARLRQLGPRPLHPQRMLGCCAHWSSPVQSLHCTVLYCTVVAVPDGTGRLFLGQVCSISRCWQMEPLAGLPSEEKVERSGEEDKTKDGGGAIVRWQERITLHYRLFPAEASDGEGGSGCLPSYSLRSLLLLLLLFFSV